MWLRNEYVINVYAFISANRLVYKLFMKSEYLKTAKTLQRAIYMVLINSVVYSVFKVCKFPR